MTWRTLTLIGIAAFIVLELVRPYAGLTQLLWMHELCVAFGPVAVIVAGSLAVEEWVRGGC